MEHTSDIVAEGKLIHETSYPQRAERYSELEVGGSVIDFYDATHKIIHEVKKSDRIEIAHEWQVKYYIWLLLKNGIEGVRGTIEYPKLRTTTQVELTDKDITLLEEMVVDIESIATSENCPPRASTKICKRCSYYDFCYINEIEP
jgi:CRISPR-associated exonuclease Cas4